MDFYTDEQRNIAFKDAVNAATVMGARMRKAAPFREGSILKYKRSLIADDESNRAGFMESWPDNILLRSAEANVSWSTGITGKCCPFCAPAGRCRTLKELRDHLSTHHPDFTYKFTKTGPTCAVITMKLKLARENNVDPMFVVGAEGYMLSARMQRKHPRFMPPRYLIKCTHPPFVVLQPEIPDSYGGYIPGAPGTADVYRNWKRDYALQQFKKQTERRPKQIPRIQTNQTIYAVRDPTPAPTPIAIATPAPIIDAAPIETAIEKAPIVTPYPKPLIDINATSTISLGSRSDVSNASIEEILSVPTPTDATREAIPAIVEPADYNHCSAPCGKTACCVNIVNCADEPAIHAEIQAQIHRSLNAVPTIAEFCANSSLGSDCEIANDDGRHRRRNPKRSARRRFPAVMTMEPEEDAEEDYGSESRRKKPSSTKVSTVCKKPPRNRKRPIPREPSGLDNVVTAHLRNSVFGAGPHLFSSGKGRALALNERATHGKLFHSVSNEPLDVEQYNGGYDSDLDDFEEIRWRIRVSDKQIFEFIDSRVDDKYYMCLWNSFCAQEGRPLGDRDVVGTWNRFLRRHGREVKRAKTEVIMTMNIFHCWEHGSLDVDGVLQLFRLFKTVCNETEKETETNDTAAGSGIPQFDMPDRIVAKYKKYDGMAGLTIDAEENNNNMMASTNSAWHAKWAAEELNDMIATSWVDQATTDSEMGLEEWFKEE